MALACIMGEAKIGPWSPIELAVLFWMLGYIKKIMSTLRSFWGTPTRESGLSRGQKMAKNANFDLTRRKLVKNLKFGVISPPLIFLLGK